MKSIIRILCVVTAVSMLLCGCSSKDDQTDPDTTATMTTTMTVPMTTTTIHAVLDATDVVVRDGPGYDYDGIGGVTNGEDLVIIGREGDWYHIQFGDGDGYISAQYVAVDGKPNRSELAQQSPATTTTTTTSRKTTTTSRLQNGAPGQTTTTTASGATQSPATNATGIPDTAYQDQF